MGHFDIFLPHEDVLFDSLSYALNKSDQYYIMNPVLLLSEYHIHESKCSIHQCSFSFFERELWQYIITMCHSKSKKAIKTTELCLLRNIYLNNLHFLLTVSFSGIIYFVHLFTYLFSCIDLHLNKVYYRYI